MYDDEPYDENALAELQYWRKKLEILAATPVNPNVHYRHTGIWLYKSKHHYRCSNEKCNYRSVILSDEFRYCPKCGQYNEVRRDSPVEARGNKITVKEHQVSTNGLITDYDALDKSLFSDINKSRGD